VLNVNRTQLHGRSRLQRYHKLANWDYVLQAAQSQDPSSRRIPVVGNGDIMSWEDWQGHQHLLEENIHRVATRAAAVAPEAGGATVEEIEGDRSALGLCNCAMLARGALIKPWLPQEINEQRVIDIPATERLDILRKYW
jgi:tRNA-dihydrouridine synthase 3